MIPRIRPSPSATPTRLRPIGPPCSRLDHLRPQLGRGRSRSWRRTLSTTTPLSQLQKPSTTAKVSSSTGGIQPIPPPLYTGPGYGPSPPPTKRRLITPTRLIISALFLCIGFLNGNQVRRAIIPPPPLDPDSPLDHEVRSDILRKASKLPLVQSLTASPDWRSFSAYSSIPSEAQSHRLTTGPLAGTRGIGGYQQVFHNPTTSEFITVIFLGNAISGWPSVVHGGALATILDESLGRCAIHQLPAKTGVTARLELRYRAPTMADNFYVVRCRPEEAEEGKSDRKVWVNGTLERVDGGVCVEARGLFVVPRGMVLQKIGDEF